jgi:hypothetical protein
MSRWSATCCRMLSDTDRGQSYRVSASRRQRSHESGTVALVSPKASCRIFHEHIRAPTARSGRLWVGPCDREWLGDILITGSRYARSVARKHGFHQVRAVDPVSCAETAPPVHPHNDAFRAAFSRSRTGVRALGAREIVQDEGG